MMANLIKRLMGRVRSRQALSYDEAKELARHSDPKVRRQLAGRSDLQPEIIYYLAEDPVPEVRRAVAENHAAPAQADLLLARDVDAEVRSGLAQKIAKLAPGLSPDEQDRLRRMAYETLQLLARDQLTRVRQVVAETLKDMAGVAPDVIRGLARDAELVVAGPVLEFSPVLSDDDLLEIITSNPVRGALTAISRRSQVAEAVADAIAGTDDKEAIAALLGNASAQIREETIDRLVDRAPEIESWHAPLVRRPKLSARAAAHLACFVADNLVKVLRDRKDLDPETADAVKAAVHRRLKGEGDEELRQALATVARLHKEGGLDEVRIVDALLANDLAFAIAAISVLSGIGVDTLNKIIATRSAKGMLAAAWKAGLSVGLAAQLQSRLARVPPNEVVKAKSYPLTQDEMEWQIGFFSAMSGRG